MIKMKTLTKKSSPKSINKNASERVKIFPKDKHSSEFEQFLRSYAVAIRKKRLFFFYPYVTKHIISLLQCLENNSRIGGYCFTTINTNGTLSNNVKEETLVHGRKKTEKIGIKENPKNKQVKVFLSHENLTNEVLVQKVIIFSGKGRRYGATVQMLHSFNYHYPNYLGLVATRYGLLSSTDCLIRNCGGELIAAISAIS
jgi:ribosomal protein S8